MKRFIVCMMLVASFFACQSDGESPIDPDIPKEEPKEEPKETPWNDRGEIQLTDAEKQMVVRNNAFAFDFFRMVLRNEDPGMNVLLSPLSATIALAMLNNGAQGITHEEVQGVLGYGDISREEMNDYFRKMLTVMREIDPDVAFESANSIWIMKNYPVLQPFIDVNKEYYEAEIRNEDFTNPATLDLINGWCAEKTHDKITKILEELSSDVIMCLINALYFKGTWTVPFDKEDTKEEAFYNLDGSTPKIPMMNKQLQLNYRKDEQFSLLELPYGSENFSMIMLLPDKDVPMSSILEKLDADHWTENAYRMYPKEVKMKIPRFKVEYERELNDDLMQMGMVSMFTPGANLTLIHPTAPLCVSMVKQKTFAEINEEGTEAAAVTIIVLTESDIGGEPAPPQIVEFYVDRPFLYFIKERSTGTIFFMGQVNNLTAE